MPYTRIFNQEEIVEACKMIATREGDVVKGNPVVHISIEPDVPGAPDIRSVKVEIHLE